MAGGACRTRRLHRPAGGGGTHRTWPRTVIRPATIRGGGPCRPPAPASRTCSGLRVLGPRRARGSAPFPRWPASVGPPWGGRALVGALLTGGGVFACRGLHCWWGWWCLAPSSVPAMMCSLACWLAGHGLVPGWRLDRTLAGRSGSCGEMKPAVPTATPAARRSCAAGGELLRRHPPAAGRVPVRALSAAYAFGAPSTKTSATASSGTRRNSPRCS